MRIVSVNIKNTLWDNLIDYANSCNWKAGPILAQKMNENKFLDWERIFVATENNGIIGFCTFTKEDGIPNCDYSPFVGFMFVDENYRGNRISEQIIDTVEDYAKTLNFEKLYISSDHKGLYEKYGFEKCDEKVDDLGRVETIFFREIK